jgi:riboflavin-specific deaminase-like protein
MERGRPWLRLKAAVSLDGRSALDNGASQWITGEAARADGHAWRKRAGAVLTGVGTVLDDDPRLDVRLVPTAHQPLRVVVDSRLQTPPTARVLAAPGRVLVYAAIDDAAKRSALEAAGAEIALLPSPSGKVDLTAMLGDLAGRGINELHAEAGEKLNASLLREAGVDELLVYLAPRLFGSGRGLAALGPFERLEQSLDFRIVDVASRRRRPAPAPAPLTPSRRQRRGAAATIEPCSPASSPASAASSKRNRSAPATASARRSRSRPREAGSPASRRRQHRPLRRMHDGGSPRARSAPLPCRDLAESLDKTAGLDGAGAEVNLEKAMRADARLDGHLVSGHVDGVGRVARFERVGESWALEVDAPSRSRASSRSRARSRSTA